MKISFLLLLLSFFSCPAQSLLGDNTLFNNRITVNGSSENKEIAGSPYLFKTDLDAKVSGYDKVVPFNYNAYKDEMEALYNGDRFIISKIPQYNKITFVDLGLEAELCNYSNLKGEETLGYLFLINKSGNKKLYKKEQINLIPEKVAKSSYEQSEPSTFKKAAPRYFITDEEGKIKEVPTNKKKFLELFPKSKNDIQVKIDKEKIDFKSESDLKKLLLLL